MKKEDLDKEFYPVTEGDRVEHIKDPGFPGTVMEVQRNLPHPTTCLVLWDDEEDRTRSGWAVTWTNKVVKIEDGRAAPGKNEVNT